MATVNVHGDKKFKQAAEQIAKDFTTELEELFKKYSCEVSVRERSSGYETYVEGIDVDFDGAYNEEHEVIKPYFTLEFNTRME